MFITRLRVDLHRNADSIVFITSQQNIDQSIHHFICDQMLILKALTDNMSDRKLKRVFLEVENEKRELKEEKATEEAEDENSEFSVDHKYTQ